MNKKKLLLAVLAICQVSFVLAGGILTNTNQSVYFIRNIARDASTEIDAAYSNPAGLVKLSDGFHFSFTNQSAFQTRTITSTFAPFAGNGGNPTKEFEGTASAPIIPSLQAAYKKDKWTLSLNLAVSGGGGKATFSQGLPSFEAGASLAPNIINSVAAAQKLPPSMLSAKGYSVEQYMTGSSFIYGLQMGGTYEINKILSVYGGFRLNIVNNSYEGHLRNLQVGLTANGLSGLGIPDNNGTLTSPEGILNLALSNPGLPANQRQSIELLHTASKDGAYLNSTQSGWGVSPIIGLNVNYEKLNVGMKFEFRTGLDVENKTSRDDTGMFTNGVNTPHDIPALFTIGASYQITDKLLASVGYHHFFDSDAKMANDKQKFINGGTNEYLAGLEYRINDMFLVSAGGQITRYGVTDEYQSDLSFSINSYSIGFGGAANVAKNVKLNAGYFWTDYSDWKVEYANYAGTNPAIPGTNVFSRTNKVFAIGVDFSF